MLQQLDSSIGHPQSIAFTHEVSLTDPPAIRRNSQPQRTYRNQRASNPLCTGSTTFTDSIC